MMKGMQMQRIMKFDNCGFSPIALKCFVIKIYIPQRLTCIVHGLKLKDLSSDVALYSQFK